MKSTHAKAKDGVILKSRYISVNQDGDEIYTEPISVQGDIRGCLLVAKLRLREIKRAMPLGKWGMNVEEQWKDRSGDSHFKIMDIETGKVKKQIL